MRDDSRAPVRRGQEHFAAPADANSLGAVDVVRVDDVPSNLWRDAWLELRRRPLFWISASLIVLVLLVAYFPQWFTSVDPTFGVLSKKYAPAESGHPFGFTLQGYDIYSRVIYGARASVTVGILTTIGVVLLGATVGAIAGFYGGWADTLLSRLTDIFFALPLVLAAIVVLQVFDASVLGVVAVLAAFGWPQVARITRGAVLSIKNEDFVTAAISLGSSRFSTLMRHVVPNSLAPIIVVATVSLGTFIVAEATLSYLGIGLPPSAVSWGRDISEANKALRSNPMVLFYPSGALAITVLSFIMLGDVVRDALDPKSRKR